MGEQEAIEMIVKALEKTAPGLSKGVGRETHLLKDGVIDSLESMNFLFELEQMNGHRLTAIDENFDDFRVARLIEILTTN